MKALVDGRCTCKRCEDRTTAIYRMIGSCSNCGAKPILFIFRVGDSATPRACPVCGVNEARPSRLATPDEIPIDFESAS